MDAGIGYRWDMATEAYILMIITLPTSWWWLANEDNVPWTVLTSRTGLHYVFVHFLARGGV